MKNILLLLCTLLVTPLPAQQVFHETTAERDARMHWWRDARFGMFIHWGLYAVPAGKWDTTTSYGEWIRTSAQIPLKRYDSLAQHFNPFRFDASQWVRMAKDAGMKYIVITSKHHDGFCLYDSRHTDFDIMSTPFKRDILKELSAACRKHGITLCFYHSIMDWHHPDYLPRREWEKDRTAEGADFERYVRHMKDQLRELVTGYGGIGVLWFDGEWETTWNDERGRDLYAYVRGLDPKIIINNRVSSSRSGMEGFTTEGGFAGDFGTPEQQIPATGLPGVDWESCMTMNDHWGYNKYNANWKSAKSIVQMLADIASKGGNYLLNVGPTAEGVFPPESVERLRDIGAWMKVNGESIYGTSASPFTALAWGRCTLKRIGSTTRLYLHVFDWPADGRLVLSGIYNAPKRSYVLSDIKKSPLTVVRKDDALIIAVGPRPANDFNSVVVLDVAGTPDVNNPPRLQSDGSIFVDTLVVHVQSGRENIQLRATIDGSEPTAASPVVTAPLTITRTATVSARCYRNGKPVSGTVRKSFTKVPALPAVHASGLAPGIRYTYAEGMWTALPAFDTLAAAASGVLPNISLSPKTLPDGFGFEYTGYILIPADGVYLFSLASDDGSRLTIGGTTVVDNDGLHGSAEKEGRIALAAGYHPLRLAYFERDGGDELTVSVKGPGMKKQPLPDGMLFYGN